MLSRWSHLNDIFWETRGVSSKRKCFKQEKGRGPKGRCPKGVVQKGVVLETSFVPPTYPRLEPPLILMTL